MTVKQCKATSRPRYIATLASAPIALLAFLSIPSLAHATPVQVASNDLVELEVFDVDDDVIANLTNANIDNFLIGTRSFGSRNSVFNISDHLVSGDNTINIKLNNGPAGWTLGWNLNVNGSAVQNFSCGIFNIFGCNNDEYREGIVYDEDIKIEVASTETVTYGFQQGVEDFFSTANGSEGSAISLGLESYLLDNGRNWAGFDIASPNLDRGVSFDLSSVQGEIISAVLSFRAIPLDDDKAEGNDFFKLLGLDQSGQHLFAEHTIGFGIDAGPNSYFNYDWQIDGRPAVPPEGFLVELDLGNFNAQEGNSLSIIGDIAEHKLLDILISDDTNVDFVRLDLQSSVPTVAGPTPIALFGLSLGLLALGSRIRDRNS